MQKVAHLRLKKETKGALMYEEIDAGGNPTVDVLGTLYVRKSAFAPAKPQNIVVTVEVNA